jgi:hypothetical protein
MIFAEEPIIREVTPNGVRTVKFSRNFLKVYQGDVLVGRVQIPRLNAENIRDYILYNRNRGMIEMFTNEAQTNVIGQLVSELYGGFVIPQNQEQRGVYTPRWLYAKYVYHWLSKHYEPDHPSDHGVPCYIPDSEDDFSNDLQAANTVEFPRTNIQDRADAPEGQFYFLSWERDYCKLVVTRDLLCGEKPTVVGQIPILEIDEEYQIRFLKSERRKAVRQILSNTNDVAALQNLYFLHNLLLPFIFYSQFPGHELNDNLLALLLARGG